jgi:putative membrane protein
MGICRPLAKLGAMTPMTTSSSTKHDQPKQPTHMKNKSITLLSTTTLALCGVLLFAPNGLTAEKDTLNASDVTFLKHEAAAGMAAVKTAELGVKKAERPEVKAFAEKLSQDHAKANARLKALAATKGVDLSNVIDPDDAETFQELEKFRGAEFDKQFLSQLVSGHKKCVSSFETASTDARDGEVRAFAGETLPGLKAHLEQARKLAGKDADTSATASVTKEPDNTARNVRDRDSRTLTPLDQGSSKSDTEITAQIRKEIIATENMSVNARNVKIITQNGKVTLRGPVETAKEKSVIGDIASRVVRSENVVSELEVK